METYCGSCKKNTGNKNSNVKRIKQSRLMLVSNCVVCGKKKSGFTKSQEVHQTIVSIKFIMNKIFRNFLFTGDKFMLKLQLKQPGCTYSQAPAYEACDSTRKPPHTSKRLETCKKSTPCLIKKASRRAADRTSKTTMFLIFHFL